MLPDSGKPRHSQIPPSELVVRKFAEARSSELQALHSILSNRLNNDFRSQRNKRRRTTSHDDRIAKKRCPNSKNTTPSDKAHGEKKKKLSRRVRRTIELKKNPESGFAVSVDGTRRLRTHVWLAKRFEMVKRWGFYVPLGLHGRGRGSRAILKKLKTGVLLHDASYYSTVQLQGSQESLLSILTSVFVPAPSINVENFHQILSGETFGSAMLYHAGKESLRPVAPVTYMFRPVQQIPSITECLSRNVDGGQQKIADVTTIRQLWISIHGAAFVEAYDALTSACKGQFDNPGGSVECISLEGQLARLELIGSKALQLLHKTLLVSSSSEKPEHDDCGELERTSILKNNDQNSNSVVNTLTVMDPRVLNKKEREGVDEENHLSSLRKCETKKHVISSKPDNETECAAVFSSLWDLSKGIRPPVEESIICMEKQQQREEFIRVGCRNSGTCGTSGEGKYGRWCPILLLKNKNHEDFVIRYSVIIPLSWAKVFWNAFISNCAHVIGLREKQWIASEIELPCFPLDFPDCNAYTHTMAMEKVITDQKVSLRPTSKKPLEIPIPPPWHSVRLNYDIGSGCGSEDRKLDDMVKHSGYATSEAKMINNPGFPLEDQIARTSSMLSDFFNTINLDNLYLFPRIPYQKSCTYEVMKHKEIPSQETIVSEAEHEKGRCFLRVLLRAYRKGVFEQGAVVCAPLAADIKLLTGSETDNEQLQVPESVLKSYFVRLPSGEWDVQVREDSAMRQCFRWPIGFITTGFVRGSKRASAVAFCEATLLSRLRIEQWRASPTKKRKKEIYVLVRNMRSTTYRLAFASIFLEQEEDFEFM